MLQINFDGDKYVARLSIDQKATVRNAGFYWDNDSKAWITHDSKCAYRLIDHATPLCEVEILKRLNLFSPDASKFEMIAWPKNQKPFDHQIAGAEHLLSRKASYLAFAPRVGKSVSSILAHNANPGHMLIICPAFLKLNWADEIKKWATHPRSICIINSQKDKVDEEADIIICPDSLIAMPVIRDQLTALLYTWVIVDEAHRFKSLEAKRTQSLLGAPKVVVNGKTVTWHGFHKLTNHIVCLSGTPMPNRPIEFHPIAAKHAPHSIDFLDRHSFAVKYCAAFMTEWGWDYNGASNLEELNEKIRRDYMLTKSFDECNDIPANLPPEFIFLDRENEKLRKAQKRILDQVKIEDLIFDECLRNDDFKTKVDARKKKAQKENTALVEGGFQYISELRKLCGLQKVEQSIKVINDMLNDGPLVVFAWHKEVIEALSEGLKSHKPFVVTGSTSNKLRHEYKNEFQKNPDRPLFIANIQAAGVGIDLSKSARVVFVEPSWVPGDNEQAIMRCAYLGQKRPVEPFFLVYENSFDHLILNANHFKEANIKKAISQNKGE
jgi:SWI/SNF-related matrix-associated actin-dependent regulator 1 of chromatin subfamily A